MKVINEKNRCLVDISEVLKLCHPVGSLYWSKNSTSPATLFGGTWTRIKDKFIYALGDTGSAGDTGGSETHYHTQGSTGGTKVLASSIQAMNTCGSDYGLQSGSPFYAGEVFVATTNAGSAHTHTNPNTNSASNMPPFVKYYCWERIA